MTSPDKTTNKVRIVIAGGGTGGHVVPALAVGKELRDKHNVDVRFMGTARGLETKLIPAAGFELELVRSGQLKNVSLMVRLRTMLDLPLGVLHCLRYLRAYKPQVVLGVGGYASGPAMMAAILLRIPTMAYEPNAVPGMTNRWIGKRVRAAAVNFAQTTKYFRNAEVTGVPVRPEIFDLPPRPLDAKPRLLVTAGSQGAKILNETLPTVAPDLLKYVDGLTIVHQAGPRHVESTKAAYEAAGADPACWSVLAFLEDMPAQYAAADVVLARSGSTVAEICAAGKPSLLVPFAGAADDHQRRNAEVLVSAGAAEMLLQRDVNPASLFDALAGMFLNPDYRATMSANARSLARPGALERIAALVMKLARSTS